MPEPKSKKEKQKTSNKRFLSTISKAFKGEYSASAVRKRKEAEKKRLAEAKRKKEMLAKRKEANLKSRVKDVAPKGAGMAAKQRASEFFSGVSGKVRRDKEGAGIKTATRTVSTVGTKEKQKPSAEKLGMRKDATKYVLSLQKKAKDAKKQGTKTKSATVSDKQKKAQTKDLNTVAAAQKRNSMFFTNKDGDKKLAITSAQLKKFQKSSGIKGYTAALRAFAKKYKGPKGMAKFKADLKKMAMGGAAMKMPSASQTGLKKLPSSVRNKMGYMMGGGMPKKSHGKAGGKSYGK